MAKINAMGMEGGSENAEKELLRSEMILTITNKSN